MKSNGLSFHHPAAFWGGCALLVAGVFSHLPMFMMGRHTHWQMVGMPIDGWMLAGMAMILAFLLACLAAVWWIFRTGWKLKA